MPPNISKSGLDLEGCDLSVSPGEDFYQYCNGNWNEEIPSDRSTWGTFISIREQTLKNVHKLVSDISANATVDAASEEGKVGMFWRAAMDTDKIEADGLEPLQDLLDQIDAVNTRQDYMQLVAQLHKLEIGVVFGCGAEADMKSSDECIMWVGEGALGLGNREYYYDEDKEDKRKAYVKHVAKIFQLAGFDNVDEAAQQVMDVELGLAKVSKTNTERRDVQAMYNPRTRTELEAGNVWEWTKYFAIAGEDCLDPDECKIFCVTNPKHLTYACLAVTDVNVSQWKHYTRWHVLKSFAKFLPSAFVEADFEFFGKTLTGQEQMEARWKKMLGFIDSQIGELLGKVYCEHHFPETSKRAMIELVDRVIASLKDMIKQDLPWMSQETKTAALVKLGTLRVKIGYPDKYKDYSELTPKANDSVISVVRQILLMEHHRDWRQANKPTNRDKWSMPPQMVNAYYSPLRNEIAFPAAILQGAAFDPERDLCANYGAIAAVIGHELTHGFDDKGKNFDHAGNLVNWWTDSDLQSFNEKKQPIVDQYSAIEILPGQFINGDLTQGENIADIGGLKCAYRAMEAALRDHPDSDQVIDSLTPAQRFFVSWGQFWRTKSRDDYLIKQLASDPHSPGNIRAFVPPSNLEEFHAAFEINETNKMYLAPEKRGNVW